MKSSRNRQSKKQSKNIHPGNVLGVVCTEGGIVVSSNRCSGPPSEHLPAFRAPVGTPMIATPGGLPP